MLLIRSLGGHLSAGAVMFACSIDVNQVLGINASQPVRNAWGVSIPAQRRGPVHRGESFLVA